MLLGPSSTDANCHGNICPGKICPGDIYPYQDYLSCYWPNFDQTFWALTFWTPIFSVLNFVWSKKKFDQKVIWPKKISNQIFWHKFFWTPIFFTQQIFYQKKKWHNIFLTQQFQFPNFFFQPKNVYFPKNFWAKKFL